MTENPKSFCPKCGKKIDHFIWGNMFDWDYPADPCPVCGYEGELDTMTGIDPDGSVYQFTKSDIDKESDTTKQRER